MKRKALCCLLAVLLVLAIFPVAVFANDGNGDEDPVRQAGYSAYTSVLTENDQVQAEAGYVCRINDGTGADTTGYYTTLGSALGAVTAAEPSP